jgi:hypothetical protein
MQPRLPNISSERQRQQNFSALQKVLFFQVKLYPSTQYIRYNESNYHKYKIIGCMNSPKRSRAINAVAIRLYKYKP